MATLLVNLSGGTLHVVSLQVILQRGGRVELPMTADQLMAAAPELSTYEKRGYVRIAEDAEIIVDAPLALPAETTTQDSAPEPHAAASLVGDAAHDDTAAIVAAMLHLDTDLHDSDTVDTLTADATPTANTDEGHLELTTAGEDLSTVESTDSDLKSE